MGKTLKKDVLVMLQTFFGKEQLLIESRQILATEILEYTAFEQFQPPFSG